VSYVKLRFGMKLRKRWRVLPRQAAQSRIRS
jgi:hypothetical protein